MGAATVMVESQIQAPSFISGDNYDLSTICCRGPRLIICKQAQANSPPRSRQGKCTDYCMGYAPSLRICQCHQRLREYACRSFIRTWTCGRSQMIYVKVQYRRRSRYFPATYGTGRPEEKGKIKSRLVKTKIGDSVWDPRLPTF